MKPALTGSSMRKRNWYKTKNTGENGARFVAAPFFWKAVLQNAWYGLCEVSL